MQLVGARLIPHQLPLVRLQWNLFELFQQVANLLTFGSTSGVSNISKLKTRVPWRVIRSMFEVLVCCLHIFDSTAIWNEYYELYCDFT